MKNALRTALLALAAPLLLTQCDRPEEPTPPAQLLPRERLVGLLIDLHIAESRVEASGLPPDSARALYRQQTKDLYWRHETDEPTLRQSITYYAIHGKDLEEIYAAVTDSLAARQARWKPAP